MMICMVLEIHMVVGEQPYKIRDMVGSDSGLGRLLVNSIKFLHFTLNDSNKIYLVENFEQHFNLKTLNKTHLEIRPRELDGTES